jgi:hypothetical protein
MYLSEVQQVVLIDLILDVTISIDPIDHPAEKMILLSILRSTLLLLWNL